MKQKIFNYLKLRHFLYALLVAVFIISCNNSKTKRRPLTLVSENGDYWGWSASHIDCDSVQFISEQAAWIWRDGTKMKIIAQKVRVYSNGN